MRVLKPVDTVITCTVLVKDVLHVLIVGDQSVIYKIEGHSIADPSDISLIVIKAISITSSSSLAISIVVKRWFPC